MSTSTDPTVTHTELPNALRRRLSWLSLATALTLAVTSACASENAGTGSKNAVVGADADEFHGTLVDPPLTPAAVTLRDTDGDAVRLDQRRPGTAAAVFFGFTNCHEICPTTMADLAAARRSLPPATAANVSLLFVTVDPKRDTPTVLRTWLDQFERDIVGLRGPAPRVHRAEDSLYASRSGKSSTQQEPADEQHTHPPASGGDGYGVDHSSIVYMFGPDGTTLIYTGGATPPDYAADLTRLLRG